MLQQDETTRGYHFWIKEPDSTTGHDRYHSKLPFLLGFNTPAKTANDNVVRDFSNVILLVVPKGEKMHLAEYNQKTFPKYYWTVAAEDLGGSFDWDFNDAVFVFTDQIKSILSTHNEKRKLMVWGPGDAVPVREFEVLPLAAGGILPIYITYTGKVFDPVSFNVSGKNIYYKDENEKLRTTLEGLETNTKEGTWVLGTELHKWLQQDNREIYNTGAKAINQNLINLAVKFCVPATFNPDSYDNNHAYDDNVGTDDKRSTENKPLIGFSVLVDKESTLDIDTKVDYGSYFKYSYEFLSDYKLGEGTYFIGKTDPANKKIAPQMIVVGCQAKNTGDGITSLATSTSTWRWPRECVNIMHAYPGFADWVEDPTNTRWRENFDPAKVTMKHLE